MYAVFVDVDQSDDEEEGPGHHHAIEVVDHLAHIDTPMIGKGVRHNDVRSHFFKDAILRGIVQPVWRTTHDLLADFPTKPVMGPRFHMLDSWYRNGIPWAHIPKLPVQPNSVFQMGICQRALGNRAGR